MMRLIPSPFVWLVVVLVTGHCPAQQLPALIPTQRDVVYGEAGGQKQLLDVYYPNMMKPAKPLPTVILLHGGAWREGSKGDMAIAAAIFTKDNFVAVSVGYRLFDPKKAPQNIWPTQLDDVQRAVRFLRANAGAYGIDPARIGVMGFSAGAHLAALLGMTDTRDNSDPALAGQSSRVKAVVTVGVPADLTADYSHLPMGAITVQDLVDDFIGRDKSPAESKLLKREASPLFRVDEKTVPFLLFHGDADVVVPVENSRKLAEALKKAGLPHEYVEFPGEGHGFKLERIPVVAEKSSAFFRKYLVP
jgi:acetyl esterase/lipase